MVTCDYKTSNDNTSCGDTSSGSVGIDPSHLGAASSAVVAMTAMGTAAMVQARVLGPGVGLPAWARAVTAEPPMTAKPQTAMKPLMAAQPRAVVKLVLANLVTQAV
jgi:hypothetical protein